MSNKQRIQKVNQLHLELQKTSNIEDRIKLHQAAIKMIEGRENEDPDDAATLQYETNAELAAIDSILAKIPSTPSKIPQIIARSINLTPSTDYRNLKNTSIEKNFEDVQAAIKSKSNENSASPIVFSTSKEKAKFQTSLTRDRLIKSFKEALDINITAKKRFLKYERQYFEKVRDLKTVGRIDKEMEKLPKVVKKAMEEVKSVTLDYSEKVWRNILAETEKLQNDAKVFVRITNENSALSSAKNTVPAEKKQYSHPAADDMSNDAIDNNDSAILNNKPPKFESAPSPLSPYAAVSPRSPRGEHCRIHSFSKSPPPPKSSSKTSSDSFDNFLLDDVSLSNIAAPIFDISGGSERGSLGFKEEKNLLDWSPGLSREFLQQQKFAKKIENVQEPESTTASTADTSISKQIDERPLDRSVEGTIKEIESFCRELWPQIEASMENEDFHSLMVPVVKSDDPEQHYYSAYRRLIARSLFSEVQTSLKKGFRFVSFDIFQNQMVEALLKKLSIERANDLLDARHIWVRKNNAFTRLVQSRNDAQDFDSAVINEYKRELVGKAIAAEDIINYSNERANRFADIGYAESVEFLRKHAPGQLAALLSQYEN